MIVGVGQSAERIGEPGYGASSAVDLGAAAARAAFDDAGLMPGPGAVPDVVVGIRQFDSSHPKAVALLGRSDNYPRSVADRLGVEPGSAVYDVVGGDSPQRLVAEFGAQIASGAADTVLLVGSEAMSTVRHFAGRADAPDHTEQRGGQLVDRGFGIDDMITASAIRHGLLGPPAQYALLEHARRARSGLSRAAYAAAMGELFAPFTEVAAVNPHAAAPTRRSAEQLVEVTAQNRLVADPYPRFLVARDQVNQGAAVLLMSVARAREAGVDPARWVFLHGHAKAADAPVLARAELGSSAAAAAALHGALASAGAAIGDIDFLDLYSCFPIAVFAACDALGIAPDDPRGLTLTGGLPYFGGAGNNYSMHAIAEVAGRVRSQPGSLGLVAANGGILSKYAVGVYSARPRQWPTGSESRAVPIVGVRDEYVGPAAVETFTVVPFGTDRHGILVCRTDTGERCYALAAPDDAGLADSLAAGEPIGQRVRIRTADGRNIAEVC